MAKSRRKGAPKTILKLRHLEPVQNCGSKQPDTGQPRSDPYDHAIREFIDWYGSESRWSFNKTVVPANESRWNSITVHLQPSSDSGGSPTLPKRKIEVKFSNLIPRFIGMESVPTRP